MQLFNCVELNIFAFAILFIIFINLRDSLEKYLFEQKLYIITVYVTAMVLILDTLMWVMDGRVGYGMRQANTFITTVYFILNPFPCILWSLYAEYKINKDKNRIRKVLKPLSIPVVLNGVLAILSPINGLLFYVDQNNRYHRGKLFIVMAVLCYLYFVYTFVQVAIQKDKLSRKEYGAMIIFAVPPFIGGIIQVLFYGVSAVWICVSISLLIIFVNIKNNQLYTDYLTGLYNHRQLDNYLAQRIKSMTIGKWLAGIMIDLDSFKKINDIYGHAVGDQALEYTAAILRKSFRKEDFIARYGGDEFIIILNVNSNEELDEVVSRIQDNTARFNAKNIVPYDITLSIGYDIFDYRSGKSTQQFLKHIDALMYQNKKKKNTVIN